MGIWPIREHSECKFKERLCAVAWARHRYPPKPLHDATVVCGETRESESPPPTFPGVQRDVSEATKVYKP